MVSHRFQLLLLYIVFCVEAIEFPPDDDTVHDSIVEDRVDSATYTNAESNRTTSRDKLLFFDPRFRDVIVGRRDYNPHSYPLSPKGFYQCSKVTRRLRKKCRADRGRQQRAVTLLRTTGLRTDTAPETNEGCMYEGQMYSVNSSVDLLPYKCMFVRCLDRGQGPEVVLHYLDSIGCCQEGNDLYATDSIISVDDCSNRICENGTWRKEKTELAVFLEAPCPDGWLDFGDSCVYIWPEMMTHKNAVAACKMLHGFPAAPRNQHQNQMLIQTLQHIPGRDESIVPGGWLGVSRRNRDGATDWAIAAAKDDISANFLPWLTGSPDRNRKTNCVGIVATSEAQGWKEFMCDSRKHMLYPICEVQKPPCGNTLDGCKDLGGPQKVFAEESSAITEECYTIHCDVNGYLFRRVNPKCCYVQQWSGDMFGESHGWHAAIFPPGEIQLFPGLFCTCVVDSAANCTQFYR